MPSVEQQPTSGPARLHAALRSQGLGIICGQAAVALLAIGSVVITVTREDASATVRMDDLSAFFEQPSPWHLWLYLLFGLFTLYALNTALATIDSVMRKWRAGTRALAFYGAAVVHVGFLLALLAHLIGGFFSEERGALAVGRLWQRLGDGREVRLLRVESDAYANGQTKTVRAHVELRDASGAVWPEVLAYNTPLSRGFGSDLWLIARVGDAAVARISDGERTCVVEVAELCPLGGKEIRLSAIYPRGHWGDVPAVMAVVRSGGQGFVVEGRTAFIGGVMISLLGVEQRAQVLLRGRHAPGNPIAAVAALIMVAGMIMMGRRWLRKAGSGAG